MRYQSPNSKRYSIKIETLVFPPEGNNSSALLNTPEQLATVVSVGSSCVSSYNSMNTTRPTPLEMPNVEINGGDIQRTCAGHVSD